MKKSYIIAPLALLIVGGAYAMTGLLFPDTPGFPRIPTGEGTVGGMIARVLGISDLLTYSGDGMVKNTSMLSGTTATGYLKRTDICTSGQYWTGIGPDGKATCGSTTILLADMGTITDVGNGMTIFRADGSTITPVVVPQVVKSGDIIKTDGTGTGTITFSDLSIIRLDTDTTVSMDQTTSGTGVTVASALLANGSIWGRILTDTGVYNIGSSDIVAAVRGTSIVVIQTGATTSIAKDPITNKFAITKTGTQGKTVLSILDSALGTGTVSTVNCRKVSTVVVNGAMAATTPPGYPSIPSEENVTTTIATGSITPEKMYLVSPGDCAHGSALSGMTPSSLYTMSPWVKENTKKDIIYMSDLSASGDLMDWMKKTKILQELVETNPKNITECSNLLGAGGTDCTDIISQGNNEKDNAISDTSPPVAPRMARCRIENKKYWGMYSGQFNRQNDMCQDAGVVAIADYTTNKTDLFFSGGKSSLPLMDQKIATDSVLADDKGIWNHKGQGGVIDNNLFITGSMFTYTTVQGKLPDATRMSNIGEFKNGYTMAYLINSPAKSNGKSNDWDYWRYPSITWLKPQANAPTATNGVTINGTQYLSYPSVLIPGGLAGKTITIELNSSPALGKTLLELGDYTRVVVGNGAHPWKCLNQTNNSIDCSSTTSSNSFQVTNDGLTVRVTVPPTGFQITRFIIGNSSQLSFNNSIQASIKTIKIN